MMRSKQNNTAKNSIYSRRDFIQETVIKSCAVIILGNSGILQLSCSKPDRGKPGASLNKEKILYKMIVVDYEKCTGCRTCETVCSSFNHKINLKGRVLQGLGNPFYSNIKVYEFNPDVSVPSVCAMCPDNPCIEACPVNPDPVTMRKALFRDKETSAVKNDPERCIGCGNCVDACKEKKTGIISLNKKSKRPQGTCSLCSGDPQCVKYCPQDALTFYRGLLENEYYGLSPEKISEILMKNWYGEKKKTGEKEG